MEKIKFDHAVREKRERREGKDEKENHNIIFIF